MKKILLLILVTFIYGCGESATYEDNITYIGPYPTKYEGNSVQANPYSMSDLQLIAKPLVDAINMGNDIFNNSIPLLLPDNSTSNIGNCDNEVGDRKYDATSISYTNYCIKNPLSLSNTTTIRGSSKLYITDDFVGRKYNLFPENIVVEIFRLVPESKTYNLYGEIIRQDKMKSVQIDGITVQKMQPDSVIIALDLDGGTSRFDFTYEWSGSIKKLIFYHYTFGYVTAELSGMKTEYIGIYDEVIFKTKDRTCIFTPDEIGTKDFNCESKPNKK